jgi:hypothetical protein
VKVDCVPSSKSHIHFHSLRSFIQRIYPGPRLLVFFLNKLIFYGEELLAPCPTPKLEDRPLLAVLRTRHAVVTRDPPHLEENLTYQSVIFIFATMRISNLTGFSTLLLYICSKFMFFILCRFCISCLQPFIPHLYLFYCFPIIVTFTLFFQT